MTSLVLLKGCHYFTLRNFENPIQNSEKAIYFALKDFYGPGLRDHFPDRRRTGTDIFERPDVKTEKHRASTAQPDQSEVTFGLLILPEFGMLSYASVADVLKQIRDCLSGKGMKWHTLGPTDAPVPASNRLFVMPDASFDDEIIYDYVIVVGFVGAAKMDNKKVLSWIRRQHRHGAIVCATGNGTWLLAKSGLLHGRRCTLHWRDIDIFNEIYPDISVSSELLVRDERVITCSGARTASDMIYHILSAQFDYEVIERVQEILFHERLRGPHECQRPDQERMQILQPKYYQLLKCIDDKIDQKVTIQEICNRLGLCQRAAERVFREHLKISPKQYQLDQRLTRAANLLHNSALALAEVAEATGFSSASSLSTSFKTKFRISPLKFRKQGAIEPGATMVGKARNRRIETLPEESRSKDTIKITPA